MATVPLASRRQGVPEPPLLDAPDYGTRKIGVLMSLLLNSEASD